MKSQEEMLQIGHEFNQRIAMLFLIGAVTRIKAIIVSTHL